MTTTSPVAEFTKLRRADPRHGTENGYRNWGCRCSRCRTAHAEYTAHEVEKRRALRVNDGSGTMIAVGIEHGGKWSYRNHRCECGPCRSAHRDQVAEYRRRKAERNAAATQ